MLLAFGFSGEGDRSFAPHPGPLLKERETGR